MLSTSRAPTLITTPPLSPVPQNALRVRSERQTLGPEQRSLRGAGRDQRELRNLRGPRERRRVCAAEQRRGDGGLCQASWYQQQAGFYRQRRRVPQAPAQLVEQQRRRAVDASL